MASSASSVSSIQTIQSSFPNYATASSSKASFQEHDPQTPAAQQVALEPAALSVPDPLQGMSEKLKQLSAQELAEECKAQQIQISLSCNWNSSRAPANQVDAAFTALGMTLLKDEEALRTVSSFDEFMKEVVKRADYTISLIDDTYLKSLLCLLDIVFIVEDPHWRERVFPIVLLNTPLDETAIDSYEQYWRTEVENLARTRGSKDFEVAIARNGVEKIGPYLRFIAQVGAKSIDLQLDAQFKESLALMLARQGLLEKKMIHPHEIFSLPFGRNKEFTGRSEELSLLREAFKPNGFGEIAIVGPPGVGKTQLALEYAYQHEKEYDTVYAVRARHIRADYSTLGRKMGVAEELLKGATLIPAVRAALEEEPGWLLIFDDAENPAAVSSAMPRWGGHVIITSRNPGWDHQISLEVFKEEESLHYLQKISGVSGQEGPLADLAKGVENFPPSLAMAGTYIRAQNSDVTAYVSAYKKEMGNSALSSRIVVECPLSVCTTWSLSSKKIAEKDFNAIKLLEFCSYLAFDPIPEILLEAFFKGGIKNSLSSFEAALKLLESYALVSRNVDYREGIYNKTVSLYPLTKQIAHRCQEIWNPRQVQERYTKNICLGVSVLERQFDENGGIDGNLVSHGQALLSRMENLSQRSEGAAPLAAKIGAFFYKTGDLAGAKEWYKKAIDMHISTHAADTYAGLIPIYLKLGDLCLTLEQHDEARTAYKRAQHINQRIGGRYNAPFDEKIRQCDGESFCVIV